MAALIGPIGAVGRGGIGTIAVTLAVARAVPRLRPLPPLHARKPEE